MYLHSKFALSYAILSVALTLASEVGEYKRKQFRRALLCQPSNSTRLTERQQKLFIPIFPVAMDSSFRSSCPCAYDLYGECRQAPYMCTASKQAAICIFKLGRTLISRDGLMLDYKDGMPYSFAHKTMSGEKPIYDRRIHERFSSYFEDPILMTSARDSHSKKRYLQVIDSSIVPLRMRWDDCFNHLSFQSLPLIGHVFSLFQNDSSQWRQLYWHASVYTAALLRLLDIPMNHIIIETPVVAQSVLLPWARSWCPPQLATLRGVANSVVRRITERLIDMARLKGITTILGPFSQLSNTKSSKAGAERNAIELYNANPHHSSDEEGGIRRWNASLSSMRCVVYLSRRKGHVRYVVNEDEILRKLRENLKPDIPLYVIRDVDSPQNKDHAKRIEGLHAIWMEFASVFSRARVLIGPHGGSFNNMMWTPDDVDMIEFNEYPDEAKHNPSNGKASVRGVFLNAFWAKQGSVRRSHHNTTAMREGNFWVIEPSRKHPRDFYVGKLRVAPREIFQVLQLIAGGSLLRDDFQLSLFPAEKHDVWQLPNPCYSCVPPPH